ncbi:hypothetical protein IQ62_18110 [Streptomyces scabiei]|nr:hypothetical protein IQ62_18110 [Streptomyces scabiei]
MLRRLARERRIVPFIGAGFSLHLGLPSWSALIQYIAESMDYDPRIFELEGNALQLAEYYMLERGRIGELRSRLDNWFNSPTIDVSKSDQHMLLVALNASVIYTTNYDNLIERAFEAKGVPHKKIVTIADIGEAAPDETQVVKFHGDLSLDDSLVLAESHYFDRLAFESPLDVKLRSDMLGKSLVFMGYGFQDINMRYMWYRLTKMWKQGRGYTDDRQPPAFYLGPGVGPVQKRILRSWKILCIELDPADPGAHLVTILRDLTS